jgi:tetratricopeptide (TPR) repeat protein
MGRSTWFFPLAIAACTMLAIETKADEWGTCRNDNPDASIFDCTALIDTGTDSAKNADEWGACRSGNPDASIFDCTAFIDAETDSTKNLAIAHYNRGRAYRDKGEFDRAISDLGKAIELDPEFLSAFRMRGVIRGLAGDYAKAMADFDKALKLSPDDEGIYLSRGLVYEAHGEKHKAAQDYRKILALNPGHKLATEALQELGE